MASTDKTVALITGANQGIGFEAAKKLATENKDYIVVLAGRRQAAVEEAVQKLKTENGLANVAPLLLDVTSDESIAAALRELETRYGRLDVLVNNAAVGMKVMEYGQARPTSIDDVTSTGARARTAWTQMFNTNLFSVAMVTDAAILLMQKSPTVGPSRPKRIVFVSSSLASLAYKHDPLSSTHSNPGRIYSTGKTALSMLAAHYMVQFEHDPANWKINCCCPGYCYTELNKFQGTNPPSSGAIVLAELATLGHDGPTGTFRNKDGPIPW